MAVLMMQDRTHDLWADCWFFAAQRIVTQHFVRIITTQFFFQNFVF